MSSIVAVVLLIGFQTIARTAEQDKEMAKGHKYSPKVNLLEPKGFSVTIEGIKQDNQMYVEQGRLRNRRQVESLSNLTDVSEGKYGIIHSFKKRRGKRKIFTLIKDINVLLREKIVLIRGRVHLSRSRAKHCFIVLRQRDRTVQCFLAVGEAVSQQMVKFVSSINRESVIDVIGKVQQTITNIRSCTQQFVEILIEEVWVVSEAEIPPIQVIDCMKPEKEPDRVSRTSKPEGVNIHVGLDKKLDNRVLDLRTPTNQAIYRLESGLGQAFREILVAKGFIEIHTPKIISAASEGGANVFKVSYFKTSAYLAQSPQMYKQMAIAADFERVFTIGAVFRAEESHTARHLTEFVGLDLEMAFNHDYSEVLDVIEQTFIEIFKTLQEKYAGEISVIRKQFKSEPFVFIEPPVRLSYSEGIAMLQEEGEDIANGANLTSNHEKLLGNLVKERFKTDFYILDKYPISVRPFYIMADPNNHKWSNSYDIFMRGEEVMSGGQRIHDVKLLIDSATHHGVDLNKIKDYVDAFRYGCPPHAGGGIGLERTVALFLGLDNIRRTSMFPRDPKRLTP